MLFDKWFAILREAQKKRQYLYERVQGRLLWTLYEQFVMLALVNEERLTRRLPAVTLKDIQAAEEKALSKGAAGSSTRFVELCIGLIDWVMP